MTFVTTWMGLEGERQILYDVTYTWILLKPNWQKQSKIVVVRGWGLGEMGNILEEVKVLRYKRNTFWRSNAQRGDYG